MISFENVDKSGFRYNMLYEYIHFVHDSILYKKFYALNAERVPKGEPVMMISNHQNGLSDALGLLFALNDDERRPVFIARADIFKNKLHSILLRFLKIMPAFRKEDTGVENLSQNYKIFDKAARILLNNGIVALYPEAGYEDCHRLGSFKKGFARIAFKAAEMSNFEKDIWIVPCSNHYSNYFGFQNKLIITIGEPFKFTDLYDKYKEHPERALKLLTDRARELVKNLMLDISDLELYDEYDILRILYSKNLCEKNNKKTSYFPNIMEAEKKIVSAIDNLRKVNPTDFSKLMKTANSYSRKIDKLHLSDQIISEKFDFGTVLLRSLFTILIIPLIIYGLFNNFVAYNLPKLITRRFNDQMLHSSFHFGFCALLTFPVCYAMLFAAVLLIAKWWIALIYFITLPISLLIYLNGKALLERQIQRFRKFKYWFEGFYIYRHAQELREELVTKLDTLIDLKSEKIKEQKVVVSVK